MQLENFDPAFFLKQYWQKKPLLIHAGFTHFQDPVTPDELAGLAMEESIESRIICDQNADHHWQVRHGPFNEEDFPSFDKNWTLLVQAVDHFLPEVAELLSAFRFIPDWRTDDVMISYAADGGSVGPHFDNYDVFLIQGHGQRRWQIGQYCQADEPLLTNNSLKILSDFRCTEEFLMEAGDILYLPPCIAHWGVAVGEALTYSVGFRAPSHSELVSHWSDYVLANLVSKSHLKDPELSADSNPGEIGGNNLEHMKALLKKLLTDNDAMEDWFAQLMTQPKYLQGDVSEIDISSSELPIDLDSLLRDGGDLYRSGDCRLAFIRHQKYHALYANGDRLNSELASTAFIEYLCQEKLLNSTHLVEYIGNANNRTVLQSLLARNCFYVD